MSQRGPKKPIMTADQERFMAFEGLVQWTQAVVWQAQRVANAKTRFSSSEFIRDPKVRHAAILNSHSEDHLFCVAANKLLEYREWTQNLGLFVAVDFSELDQFDRSKIRDLRNMREHIVDYFRGNGRDADRWMVQTPEFTADASSVVGTLSADVWTGKFLGA